MHAITMNKVKCPLCFVFNYRSVAFQMENRMNPVTMWILVKHSHHREAVLLYSGKLLPCVLEQKGGQWCMLCIFYILQLTKGYIQDKATSF